MSKKTHETFNRRSGEILRLAVNTESQLELFLSKYFCGHSYYKVNLIEDEILQKLNFDRKIKIFKKICNHIKYDQTKLQKIIEDIRFIQKNRNKVAHFESSYREDPDNPEIAEVRLWPRTSMKTKDKSLVLTKELMEEINRCYLSIYKGTLDVQNYLLQLENQSENNLDTDWDNDSANTN